MRISTNNQCLLGHRQALGISWHSTSCPMLAAIRPSHLTSPDKGYFTGKNKLKSHSQPIWTARRILLVKTCGYPFPRTPFNYFPSIALLFADSWYGADSILLISLTNWVFEPLQNPCRLGLIILKFSWRLEFDLSPQK